MDVVEASIPELTGGEKRDLVLSGKALPPGKYVIRTVATSNAGLFRSADTVSLHTDLRVWPTHPQPQSLVSLGATPTIARFDTAVEIGAASDSGVECAINITGFTDVGVGVVIAPVSAIQVSPGAALVSGAGDSGIYHLIWSFPAKISMEAVRFKLMMHRAVPTDWSKVMRSTRLACNYATTGSSKYEGALQRKQSCDVPLFFCFAVLIFRLAVAAYVEVRGKVVDIGNQDNKGIAGVEVALMTSARARLGRTVTDADRQFSITVKSVPTSPLITEFKKINFAENPKIADVKKLDAPQPDVGLVNAMETIRTTKRQRHISLRLQAES